MFNDFLQVLIQTQKDQEIFFPRSQFKTLVTRTDAFPVVKNSDCQIKVMEDIEDQKKEPWCDEEVYITSEQVMNQINQKLNYTKNSTQAINTDDKGAHDNQVEQMQIDSDNNLENVNSFIKILQHKYK